MSVEIESNELFRLLHDKAPDFHGTTIHFVEFEAMVLRATREFSHHLNNARANFPDYTLHDEDHAFRVCTLMYRLLSEETRARLNVVEVGLLILSAYGHDVGMALARSARDQREETREYKDFILENEERWLQAQGARDAGRHREAEHLLGLLFQDYLRRTHHRESERWIQKDFAGGLKVDGHTVANAVAALARSHGEPLEYVEKLRKIPFATKFSCDMPFLAVLLRLADYLDLDPARAPESLISLLSPDNEESRREWIKHQATQFYVDDKRVEFIASFSDYFEEKVLRDTLRDLERERRECLDFLRSRAAGSLTLNLSRPIEISITSDGYLFEEFRFSLEYNEILSLLMGTRLYSDERVFMRELIQNALDACRFAEAAAEEANRNYQGRVIIRQYTNADGRPVVEVTDNGAGMTRAVISNYFMRVGRSYYSSFAFKRKQLKVAPVSQFGIGVLACFMAADYMEVETQPDPYAHADKQGNEPERLLLEIRGPAEYFVVRERPHAKSGTTVRLFLRKPLDLALTELVRRFLGRIPYVVEIADRQQSPEVIEPEPFDFDDKRFEDIFLTYPNAFGYASRDLHFEGRFGVELHGSMRLFMLEADGRRQLQLKNVGYYSFVGFAQSGETLVNSQRLTPEILAGVKDRLALVQNQIPRFPLDLQQDLRAILREFERVGETLLSRDSARRTDIMWTSLIAQTNALRTNPTFAGLPRSLGVTAELDQARSNLESFVSGQICLSAPVGIITQDGMRLDDFFDLPSKLGLGIGYFYNLDLCGEHRLGMNAARNQILHDQKLAGFIRHIHRVAGALMGRWFAEEGVQEEQVQEHCRHLVTTLASEIIEAFRISSGA